MVLRVHVLYNARVAQLVEYDLAKVGVAGSSPVSRSCNEKFAYAAVAQSVERRIGSAEVTGPIPVSSFKREWKLLGIKGSAFFIMSFNQKNTIILF